MKYDLSILIPAKNEKYLQKTVEDLKIKIQGNTEILWEEDTIYGQRALTNKLAKKAQGRYLMKIDAHCLFSNGFDTELIESMDKNPNSIMAPYLLGLDAENWTPIHRPSSSQYCFDTNLVFQYNKNRENTDVLVETMCLQGSAWVISAENYWKWNICDETLGSWGGQAAELGIKAYLNGGRCLTNKNCYYAHLFREHEEDFPYQRNKEHIRATLEELRKRFKNKSIAGLIEKFNYPADWSKEEVEKLLVN